LPFTPPPLLPHSTGFSGRPTRQFSHPTFIPFIMAGWKARTPFSFPRGQVFEVLHSRMIVSSNLTFFLGPVPLPFFPISGPASLSLVFLLFVTFPGGNSPLLQALFQSLASSFHSFPYTRKMNTFPLGSSTLFNLILSAGFFFCLNFPAISSLHFFRVAWSGCCFNFIAWFLLLTPFPCVLVGVYSLPGKSKNNRQPPALLHPPGGLICSLLRGLFLRLFWTAFPT